MDVISGTTLIVMVVGADDIQPFAPVPVTE